MDTPESDRTTSINQGIEVAHTLMKSGALKHISYYRQKLAHEIEQARTKFITESIPQIQQIAEGAQVPLERFDRNWRHLHHLLNFSEGFEEGVGLQTTL